jgi:glutathionyl-hydroquinone reductase
VELTNVAPRYASAADTAAHGEYRITRAPGDERPVYRFRGRITADGSSGFPAEAGRYHLYSGWFCPWAQRVTIVRLLAGLEDVVSLSYVDGTRDGRGWAFRETHGADPVNGFTLLREAYDATEPEFDGHVSVPTLWDRVTGRVVSNEFRTMGIDLATQFRDFAQPSIPTYPAELADDIEALDAWIGPAVNWGVHRARGTGPEAEQARAALHDAFARLDERLATRRYLLGNRLTEADVRLYVTLVRYDARPGGHPDDADRRPLDAYPHLAAYARDLYAVPAFQATTWFPSFTGPSPAELAWRGRAGRGGRAGWPPPARVDEVRPWR